MALFDEREAHVKRIFQLNSDNTVNEDVWIDVLRIDKLPVRFQADAHTGAQGQVIDCTFKWNDDPSNPQRVDDSLADAQQEHGNGSRQSELLRLRDPDDPSVETEIKLWLVKGFTVLRDGQGHGAASQGIKLKFKNYDDDQDSGLPPDSSREVTIVKVVNNDLDGRDLKKAETIDWDAYLKLLKLGETDKDQHLDVEVTDKFKCRFQADDQTGAQGQVVFWNPKNEDLEKLFEPGNAKAVDANGKPSLIRTDPLQTIVNVGFGGLAVIFGQYAEDAPPQK